MHSTDSGRVSVAELDCSRDESNQEWGEKRPTTTHLPYLCSEKGDSRLAYGFFQLSRNVYGLLSRGAGRGFCRAASVRSSQAASVRHSPFQRAPMAPLQGMVKSRNQDCDILGKKVPLQRLAILWFYNSNARKQLCNMNLISVMNYSSFRQVEVWIMEFCASHLATAIPMHLAKEIVLSILNK